MISTFPEMEGWWFPCKEMALIVFISTLALPPNAGGNIVPVTFGSLLGPDTTSLVGDWHHFTDNGGASGFSLFNLQSENAYVGVEFDIAGQTHYGWIQYEGFFIAEFILDTPNGPLTTVGINVLGGFIDAWGYETEPGVPILVGAVPEPSSSLLATIGACFLFRRKRIVSQ